jgi:ankyrin repeat protein
MSLFNLLPDDIQRLICFLFLSAKDIKKVCPKFYHNSQDVYWKEMASTLTDERLPHGTSYRDFYESSLFDKVLSGREWNMQLLAKMIEDEISLSKLINMHDIYNRTALLAAASCMQEEHIKLLLDAGANINHRDIFTLTALMIVARIPRKENLKLLLARGADIDYQDQHGWTALMHAANYSCEESVKILIDAGADLNHRDKYGHTILSMAKTDTIKTLLTKS